MAITFHNEGTDFKLRGKRTISAWVREVISREGFRPGDLSFVFCSSDYHIGINRQYLGHDYHTDVITFDYSDLQTTRIVSGDILIDTETVRDNAATLGVDPNAELHRVIIHGVLHLCGYKDKTPEEEAAMRLKENEALELLPV